MSLFCISVAGCGSSDSAGVDAPLNSNAPAKPDSMKGTPALAPAGAGGGAAAPAGQKGAPGAAGAAAGAKAASAN